MPRFLTPLPVLVIAAVSGLLLGGAPATAIQETSGEKVLRIQWGGLPSTVDPQRLAYVSEIAVAGLNWEGLTRIDEQMNTVPAAAESWEFSPDGLTLTFHLRDGLVYSDGSPLTAERFRYAIERSCDPRTDSPYVQVLFAIDGCEAFFTSVETSETDGAAAPPDVTDNPAFAAARANLGVRAVDDQTLVLRLRQPAAYLPTAASLGVFFPAKQELVEAGGGEWWRDPANLVGNGPFQIASLRNDTDPSSRTVFIANERYWAGPPKLDRIEYATSSEWRERWDVEEAYERGELDMAWLVEPPDSPLAPDQLFTPRAATGYLGFNLTREPFTDPKVREAFAYAFDRDSFCRDVIHDLCTPTLSWIPPGVPGHAETSAFAFDQERAQQALAESSYGGPDRLPEITWYFLPSAAGQSLSSQFTAEWVVNLYRRVLGVELTLLPVTADEWDALDEGPLEVKPQFMFYTWYQDYPDPQNWLSVYWTCASPWSTSRVGYCNPDFDALIARADAELDPATRLILYQEAEQLLLADAPAIFLYNPKTGVLVKPYVTGYAVTGMDYWPGWTTPLTIDVERPA
jgi:oligopeptide transport system substrate-binding protein